MLVCSVSENDHKFTIKSGEFVIKDLIIAGTNSASKAKKGNVTLPYSYTAIEPGDWDAIVAQFSHSSLIKHGVIFADKSDAKTKEKSHDEEVQAVDSGTRQIDLGQLRYGTEQI